MSGIDAKALGQKESIEISHLKLRLFFSQALERVYVHSTLRSRTKSITGYSVTGQRVSHAGVFVSMYVEVPPVYLSVDVLVRCVCVTHAHTRTYSASPVS